MTHTTIWANYQWYYLYFILQDFLSHPFAQLILFQQLKFPFLQAFTGETITAISIRCHTTAVALQAYAGNEAIFGKAVTFLIAADTKVYCSE